MCKLTKEDFIKLNIDNIILKIEHKNYNNYKIKFFYEYQNSINEIYKLFYLICDISMEFIDNKVEYSYPYNNMLNQEKMDIQYFNQDEISFLKDILDLIKDNILKARIADILWIREKHTDYAYKAIEAYTKIKLSNEEINKMCWNRAIDISNAIKNNNKKLKNKIVNTIYKEIDNYSFDTKNGYYLHNLYLMTKKLEIDEKHCNTILNKIEKIFNILKSEKDINILMINDYTDILLDFYKDSNDKKYKIYNNMANIYLSIDCHGLIRSINIQNAIEMYYKIPKKERINFITEDKIEELLIEKKTSNKESISEMNTFQFSCKYPDNIAIEFEKDIKSLESDLEKLDYLFSQTSINIYDIHKEISYRMDKCIYSIADFMTIRYNFDQDKIRKIIIPSYPFKNNDDKEKYRILRMREYYKINIQTIIINILILSKYLKSYSNINYNYIQEICKYSPIIPNDRKNIFTKAIYLGYQDDYISSLSILIPQVENMVRFLLNSRGVNTRNMGRNNSFDKELSFEELLVNKKDNIIKIFGDDLYFEFYTLFSNDDLCYNTRNNLSHGLIGDKDFYSPYYIYVWLLIFRIIFCSYKSYIYRNINN